MKKALFVILACLHVGPNFAFADGGKNSAIGEIEIREVPDFGAAIMIDNECEVSPTVDNIGWGDVVNIGRQFWDLIQANKPVVHVESPIAHAMPRGLICWSQLANWQAPLTRSYLVTYKNLFRVEVVKFHFRLHYTYGGSYQGRGRYLTNVTVLPADLDVVLGYKFNADIVVNRAVNRGTEKDPVGGLELNLKWVVSTALKESNSTVSFFVDGNGNVQFNE